MTPDDDMKRHYDFSKGTRGKFHREYHQGTNLAVIEPDLHRFFPDSEAVNFALRQLVEVMRHRPALRTQTRRAKPMRRTAMR